MKKYVLKAFIFLTGAMLYSSCVNEEYDLDKEIDTQATILKNLSVPVGDLGKVTMADILDLSDQSLINESQNGDYIIHIDGQDVSESIKLDNLDFNGNYIQTEPVIIYFPTFNISQSQQQISYSSISGSVLDTEMIVDIDADLPEMIVDIRTIDVDSEITIAFENNQGNVYIKKGFKFEFPSYFKLSKVNSYSSDYSITNGNIVTFSQDVKVSSTTGYTMKLKVNSITIPSGSVRNSHMSFNEVIGISGDFYMNCSDFPTGSNNLKVQMLASVTDVEVESAEVKIAINKNLSSHLIEIPEIPEVLGGPDITLDFYNPYINMEIVNMTPAPVSLGADLIVNIPTGNQNSPYVTVAVNPFGSSNERLNLSSYDFGKYLISRRPMVANSSDIERIVVPGLGELLRNIPEAETIGVDYISVISDSDEFLTFDMSENYRLSLDYEINVPLSFGKDMKLAFTYDIDGLGFSEDTSMESMELHFDIHNSIPLNFLINASALNSDGNENNNVKFDLEGNIAAGTIDCPTVNSVVLKLRNNSGNFEMSGLRLKLDASTEYEGYALNKNQGLEIKNISLVLPDGITIDLDAQEN